MNKAAVLFSCALVFLAAHFFSTAAFAQDYLLGEGDLLRISVYANDDLTTQVRVSGDLAINFPLIGSVKVAGLTAAQAEKKIAKLLSDGFLVDPQVTVFVLEYRSKRVTILGEIKMPGVYELNGNVTILEIISKAAGLTENAGDTVIIKRKKKSGDSVYQASDMQEITLNLKDLTEKGDLTNNINVQDGDSIFIMKSGLVYVTGEVKNPGAYKIGHETTVMKAITLAGGLTETASSGRPTIIRKVDGAEKSFKVDMGYIVQPNDVIKVPESFF